MSCKTGYRSHAKAPGDRSEASSCQDQACANRHSGYTPEIAAYNRHFCPWSQIANGWWWWSWFCRFCCFCFSCCCFYLSQKEIHRGIGSFSESVAKAKVAPMFNMAAASLKDVTSATQSPTQLTIQEILEPKAPNLRENQLSGTTAANVKKWTQNFNLEAQQMSKKIMDIIKAAKCTKEQLQQASTQYGLNLSDVLKLSIISLQQAVAVGAAVTAWLAMDVSKHRPKAVLDYMTVLSSVFIKIVHFVPAVNKSCAIWALGLLHLICLFHFASRTYHTQVWQRRLQNLGINPESYTFVFFQCTAVAYLKMQFNLPNSASLSYEQAGRFLYRPHIHWNGQAGIR